MSEPYELTHVPSSVLQTSTRQTPVLHRKVSITAATARAARWRICPVLLRVDFLENPRFDQSTARHHDRVDTLSINSSVPLLVREAVAVSHKPRGRSFLRFLVVSGFLIPVLYSAGHLGDISPVCLSGVPLLLERPWRVIAATWVSASTRDTSETAVILWSLVPARIFTVTGTSPETRIHAVQMRTIFSGWSKSARPWPWR